MSGSLFYKALEDARKSHVPGTLADGVLPAKGAQLPAFLAELSLNCSTSSQKFDLGVKALQEFSHKSNSTYDLQTYLPVFADYFGYIF
jgi:hypothetical protein